MTPKDKPAFANQIAGMARLFSTEIDDVLLDAYWVALIDWDIDSFTSAVAYLLANSQWMPKPYDFNQLRRAKMLSAGEAWEIAVKNCQCWRGGPTPGGVIDDTVKMIGGYRAIAFARIESDLHFLNKRFVEAYDDAIDRQVIAQALPTLPALPLHDEKKKELLTLVKDNVKQLAIGNKSKSTDSNDNK